MLNIGDRVKVKEYKDIPEEYRSSGNAKNCGKMATIMDRLYSASAGRDLYEIAVDGNKGVSSLLFGEEAFLPVGPVRRSVRIEVEGDRLFAILSEETEFTEREIAREASIVYKNATNYEFAKAVSFACYKLMNTVKGLTDVNKTNEHKEEQ